MRVWTRFITGALPTAQISLRPSTGLRDAEGESHALYNSFSTWRSVAARVGDGIHRGIFYSHPAGHCRCHGGDQPHSREKIGIVQLHEKRESGSAVPASNPMTGRLGPTDHPSHQKPTGEKP